MSAELAVTMMWAVWYVTWIAAVVFSGKTKVQMRRDAMGVYRSIAGLGFLLLFAPVAGQGSLFWAPWARGWFDPLWSARPVLKWLLFVLVGAGFAFCWWARAHLGRLWSGLVTLKEDHHIVDTGPYGLVRHPIYAGVMFAALMTAGLKATPASFLGFAMVTLGFGWVARVEEKFLRAELGEGAYGAYSARVPMLIPRLGGAVA